MQPGDSQAGRLAGGDGWFATTQWSVVLKAGQTTRPEAREALDQLCATYRPALLAYAGGLRLSHPDAEDLTQSFFAHLIAHNLPGKVARQPNAKFRSFLLRCFKNFLADERDRARAAKRGGSIELVSLDEQSEKEFGGGQRSEPPSPEDQFERRWAAAILERAMTRLQQERTDRDRPGEFDLLAGYLLEDTRKVDYSPVAARLGWTRNAVAAAIYRLRKRYRQLVRLEVAETVSDPEQIDEEMQHLFEVLSR